MRSKASKPTYVDLFAGCGGLSLGLEWAGFRRVAAIEISPDVALSYHHNLICREASSGYQWTDFIRRSDLQMASGLIVGDIAERLDDFITSCQRSSLNIDLVVGGPPCQGLSLSGPRNPDDPRNKLFLSFVKVTDILKPKAFVLENVPGIFGLYEGKIKQTVISEFSRIGYVVSASTLTAADYGVPQLRKRAFFVGIRGAYERFLFPAATHFESTSIFSNGNNTYISCEAAISDLPSLEHDAGDDRLPYGMPPMNDYQKLMREGSNYIYNHVATQHTEIVKRIISLVPEGGNYKDLPQEYSHTRNFHVAWTRYDSKKPAPTIDTGHRHHFHYKYNRVPTVRENARLQSFPDTFIFYGNKSSQYRQVGNAVPPLLAKAIALELRKWL